MSGRKRHCAEEGGVVKPWGGRLAVALVYPNTFFHGMSNLGFQYVYHFFSQCEETLCERFFLPDSREKTDRLASCESGRPLADFDLICFSISFENDYLNLPRLFELARLPLWARERDSRHPLVVCGGVVAFLNPEPLADIMDIFALGDGELLLPDLLEAVLTESDREHLLETLAKMEGFYVPRFWADARGQGGGFQALRPGMVRPRRRWLRDLNSSSCRSFLFCKGSEFADLGLVEVSRGCGRGCRFCAAGHIYRPPRERAPEVLAQDLEAMRPFRSRFGLVGAAISDYSRLPELFAEVDKRKGDFSVSSVRIDSLGAELVQRLASSGQRTLALAPEAGSARLRAVINKGITEEQIEEAIVLAMSAGIVNLKLYFLNGLPTETDEDIEEMVCLTHKIHAIWIEEGKKKGCLGNLVLSVNPFVPKPFTPFQWEGMMPLAILKARNARLRAAVAPLGRTEIFFESLRSAEIQALLSRGDRAVARLLPALGRGQSLKDTCREQGMDPVFYVNRQADRDEVFPWEVIDCGIDREYLWKEHEKGLQMQISPTCRDACQHCGVCG